MAIATADVIVVGLGAMGSATAYHLAKAGCRVLGVDQFAPPHALGSSHGQTRIIREAYFEHPSYVPLVQRAYELWHALEQLDGRRLFTPTGGLMIGPVDGVVFQGARRSAQAHGLVHEILTDTEIQQRFPALQPSAGMAGVWEPRAGILYPEICIAAHLAQARQLGARLELQVRVQRWERDGAGIRVITDQGIWSAGQLVISAGPWAKDLLPDLELPLTVERQVLFWFDAFADAFLFHPERLPIYLWELEPGRFFYGFPNLGEGIKVAGHHDGQVTTASEVDREVHSAETSQIRSILHRFMPKAAGQLRSAVVCLYTNTPDGHFLIDRHPECSPVLIASPCSGHGFKFASAIGEVLADLLVKGTSRFDLKLFRLERFWRR
jgi:sarcosine oxidase